MDRLARDDAGCPPRRSEWSFSSSSDNGTIWLILISKCKSSLANRDRREFSLPLKPSTRSVKQTYVPPPPIHSNFCVQTVCGNYRCQIPPIPGYASYALVPQTFLLHTDGHHRTNLGRTAGYPCQIPIQELIRTTEEIRKANLARRQS